MISYDNVADVCNTETITGHNNFLKICNRCTHNIKENFLLICVFNCPDANSVVTQRGNDCSLREYGTSSTLCIHMSVLEYVFVFMYACVCMCASACVIVHAWVHV